MSGHFFFWQTVAMGVYTLTHTRTNEYVTVFFNMTFHHFEDG